MNHPGQDTHQANFPTTQWSIVLDAAAVEPGLAEAALEKLCRRYWYPVYAFVRHKGNDIHSAEDLTQGFFAFMLQQNMLHRVDPHRGRFRTFLLASLNNYLCNEYDRGQALKRGGRNQHVSLDQISAEKQYSREPADRLTPEKLFEKQWATLLVCRVMERLRREYEQRGNVGLFDALQPLLTGDPDAGTYEKLSRQLGMTPGSVKVALHRVRRRFGELLRHEVAHTVSHPSEVEEELRQLLAAIAE